MRWPGHLQENLLHNEETDYTGIARVSVPLLTPGTEERWADSALGETRVRGLGAEEPDTSQSPARPGPAVEPNRLLHSVLLRHHLGDVGKSCFGQTRKGVMEGKMRTQRQEQ